MNSSKTRTKGKIIPIKFTENPSPGVYYTDDESHIFYNCLTLEIDLVGSENEPSFMDVHHGKHFFVVTVKMNMKYTQHIFSNYAAKEVVRKFVESLPKEATELIIDVTGL